ncbi:MULTISPECIES: hypothetical protein [unclassified Colwellia]|uniref:hypothetical protein n=1 Tax=unclassified Colwellia TaxID=196834 RepID=UPI0015F480DF|nr:MULTISPECIES: hypothetical protein [unclassified Colwellia]MBA6234059.1 hypothetical protein [Colwellia sp. MB02u-7]MBA6238019.1 hypothetical protein [Colwellia sp. MB02u-11]MBA6300733.1 hypothetical protein [Colwellia sp. MB3u-22]MBA6311368.1 hypothetical protein [Colwellia sp. MB3u-64]
MKPMCGTIFLKRHAQKGIVYRIFSLKNDKSFSMIIDASTYPKECWGEYHDSIEHFINSLNENVKRQFWIRYKDNNGFVDWSKAIDSNLNKNIDTGFDHQLINNLIDDFHLKMLTCD